MTKSELLEGIRSLASSQLISKAEVNAAFDEGSGKTKGEKRKSLVSTILYYLGGAIVAIGIAILVAQNWNMLGVVAKVLITLGMGIAFYIGASLLFKDPKTQGAANAFFLISALTSPVGLYVLFNQAGFNLNSFGVQSAVSAILFITFFASYLVFKTRLFTLVSVGYGTWLFFSLTSLPHFSFNADLYAAYRVLFVGLCYIALGWLLKNTNEKPIIGFLYGAGSAGALGAMLALTSLPSGNPNLFWIIVLPIIALATMLASSPLKQKILILTGGVFFLSDIFRITAQYFSKGLGWPLALVIAGFVFMGVGYLAVYLSRKRTAE